MAYNAYNNEANMRERVLRKDSDIEIIALHRAAEIRQASDSDPDRLRERMVRGARLLRIAQAQHPKSREELMRLAIEARQEASDSKTS